MTDSFAGEVEWKIPKRSRVSVEKLAETILVNRGLPFESHNQILKPDYHKLGDPFLLPDMQLAVNHILDLKHSNKPIVIYGDYDIDGLTATTVLTEVLRGAGFQVEPYIPDRFVEGYGLHQEALSNLQAQGVDTVITVDCGSTATKQVELAARSGLNIIVTDHHTLAEAGVSGAIAHINPLRPESKYPDQKLAAVGVAFNLIRALQQADSTILPRGQEKWLLDLVALGTICDVVPLIGENRIMAHWGLQVMKQGRRVGIRALAQASGVELSNLHGDDIGFKFGPRLNAAGRLDHAKTALGLLLSEDMTESAQAASQLQTLNASRVEQTATVLAAAQLQAAAQSDQSVLVVADAQWSHGVAGLVASRLAEEFRKPTLVLQIQGKSAKGSGRSVGNFKLIDALKSQSDLLTKFGGHAAAAGLTIPTHQIDALRQGLHEYCLNQAIYNQFNTILSADLWLESDWLSPSGLEQLVKLEPYGNSHPQPLFYFESTVQSLRPVGKNGHHYQITSLNDLGQIRMIAFSAAQRWPWLKAGQKISGLVNVKQSTWQGRQQADVIVVDLKLQVVSDDE